MAFSYASSHERQRRMDAGFSSATTLIVHCFSLLLRHRVEHHRPAVFFVKIGKYLVHISRMVPLQLAGNIGAGIMAGPGAGSIRRFSARPLLPTGGGNGKHTLLSASADGNAEKVAELLENDADADAEGRWGRTPADWGERLGYVQILDLLGH